MHHAVSLTLVIHTCIHTTNQPSGSCRVAVKCKKISSKVFWETFHSTKIPPILMKHLGFHQSLFLPMEKWASSFFLFFLKISNDLLYSSGNSGWTVSWKLCCILLCWLRPAFLSQSHDYSFLGASLQPQFQKDGTLKFITRLTWDNILFLFKLRWFWI